MNIVMTCCDYDTYIQYNTIYYNTIQYKYNTIPYNTIPYHTLHYITLQCITLHYITYIVTMINVHIHIYIYTYTSIPRIQWIPRASARFERRLCHGDPRRGGLAGWNAIR